MIEIKNTSKSDVKRLIVYSSDDILEQSFGVKLNKDELYSLYVELREIIKQMDKTLINDLEEV